MLPFPAGPQAAESLREVAMTPEHQLTHLPKNPFCEVCRRAKLSNAQHRRKVNRAEASSSLPELPPRFGGRLVADHVVAHSERSRGFTGDKNALVLRDVYTGYIGCYPMKTKSGPETVHRMTEFIGTDQCVSMVYSDNSPELKYAVKRFKGPSGATAHATSTPGFPATNSLAEGTVKLVAEGARSMLANAGLPACCWPWASRYFVHSYNIRLVDGDSAWNRRHNNGHFEGQRIPFGALVHFMGTPQEMKALPKGAPRGIPGIFLGWKIMPGGAWNREYHVLRLSDLAGANFYDGVDTFPATERTVLRVEWNGICTYPCRSEWEKANHTIGGLVDGLGRAPEGDAPDDADDGPPGPGGDP